MEQLSQSAQTSSFDSISLTSTTSAFLLADTKFRQ